MYEDARADVYGVGVEDFRGYGNCISTKYAALGGQCQGAVCLGSVLAVIGALWGHGRERVTRFRIRSDQGCGWDDEQPIQQTPA